MARAVLEQLAQALAEERSALVERDIQRLIHASQSKRAALQALQSDPPDGHDQRLSELAEANRFNGALLARRRHEVEASLHHLGGGENIPAYDAHGHYQQAQSKRVLAVA